MEFKESPLSLRFLPGEFKLILVKIKCTTTHFQWRAIHRFLQKKEQDSTWSLVGSVMFCPKSEPWITEKREKQDFPTKTIFHFFIYFIFKNEIGPQNQDSRRKKRDHAFCRALLVGGHQLLPVYTTSNPGFFDCFTEELSFTNEVEEGEQAIIMNEADRVECTVYGNPKPVVSWTIRNVPVNPTGKVLQRIMTA